MLRLEPGSAQYYSNIGVTYMRLGLYHSAEACFNRGTELCEKQGIRARECQARENLQALASYLPSELSAKQRRTTNVVRFSIAVPPAPAAELSSPP